MPTKKYIVTLTKSERVLLREILDKGKHNTQKRKRAQALLLADENCTDDMIALRIGMSRRGMEQLRQRFAGACLLASVNFQSKFASAAYHLRPSEISIAGNMCVVYTSPVGCAAYPKALLPDPWQNGSLSGGSKRRGQ